MTQDKNYPKMCQDCRHSEKSKWVTNFCQHPKVTANDGWILSGNTQNGYSCFLERSNRSWFAKCGVKGKLFEPKVQPIVMCSGSGGGNLSPTATTKYSGGSGKTGCSDPPINTTNKV